MSRPGSNLPEFRAVQLEFAAHIRDPETHERPADVEARRMQIYVDLFFNNIKSFLDSAFPVAAEIVGADGWRRLAREFVHLHGSESPYFLQISEEFLTFLDERGLDGLPAFLLELCHYEWVELALDVAVEEADPAGYDRQGELTGWLTVSPLARPLVYQFPVHKIGVGFQPDEPPAQPTYLIVYRNEALDVRFVESNPVTHRLLELLHSMTAADALARIRGELVEGGRQISEPKMHEQGIQTLTHLRNLGIILGSTVRTGT